MNGLEPRAEADRLKAAIRAYTVDARDEAGKLVPNGPREAAHDKVCDLFEALLRDNRITLEEAQIWLAYLDASIEQLVELRTAADEFFGENFLEDSMRRTA